MAKELGADSWLYIEPAQREIKVKQALEALVKKSTVKIELRSSLSEAASFLNDDRSRIRQQGNVAAHSGDQNEIRDAIHMISTGQKDRELLSFFYTLFYNDDDI